MNQKEIKELIELLVEKDITEFELERGDMKVHVSAEAPPPPWFTWHPRRDRGSDGARGFSRSFSYRLHSRRLLHRHLPMSS